MVDYCRERISITINFNNNYNNLNINIRNKLKYATMKFFGEVTISFCIFMLYI